MFGHGFGSKFPRHYFKLWNLVKPQRKDPRVVSWCARDSVPRRAVPAAGQEPASGVHTQPAPLLADQRRHRRKKKDHPPPVPSCTSQPRSHLSLSWICCPSRAPRPWMDPGASGGWMPGSGSGRCCYWRGGGPLGVPGTWGVTARPLRGARASWFGAGWH